MTTVWNDDPEIRAIVDAEDGSLRDLRVAEDEAMPLLNVDAYTPLTEIFQ